MLTTKVTIMILAVFFKASKGQHDTCGNGKPCLTGHTAFMQIYESWIKLKNLDSKCKPKARNIHKYLEHDFIGKGR